MSRIRLLQSVADVGEANVRKFSYRYRPIIQGGKLGEGAGEL